MSQHDFNIANQGFPATRADLNNALEALATQSSGATAPSTTYAYQLWYDSSANLFKMRNADNDGWITLAFFDQTNDEWEVRTSVIQAVDSAGVVIKTDDGTIRLTVADDGSVVVGGTIQASNLSATGSTSNRNVLINGNFLVNQRAVSGSVVLAAGEYGHDRFKAGASGCSYTFSTSANVTTLSISAGSLVQVVEGANLQSDTYTLSWTGTAQGKIGGGSYGDSGVSASVTGGSDLSVEFNTGTLSLAQLEIGTATPFEHRSYGDELARCKRYLQRWDYTTLDRIPMNGGWEAALFKELVPEMRSSPTISYQYLEVRDDRNAPSTITATGGESHAVYFLCGATASGGGGTLRYTSSGGYLNLDAEL